MLKRSKRRALYGLALRVLLIVQALIAGVTSEEQSMMDDSNIIDPANKISSGVSPNQTVKNFVINPDDNRWLISINYGNVEADGSAEFLVD